MAATPTAGTTPGATNPWPIEITGRFPTELVLDVTPVRPAFKITHRPLATSTGRLWSF